MPPNFIVILTDDQSWVGSSALMDPENSQTKSDYFRTPHIERLMAMGMRFTQGYAPAPFCCPTRRSIQVGQTPARHLYQIDQNAWPAQYRKQLNIPRMLKAAGPRYQTAHYGKWDHRFDNITPHDQGYDDSDGYTSNRTGSGKGTGGPAAKDDPKLMHHITRQSINFLIFHHAVSRSAETALRLGDLKLVKTWQSNRLELFDLSKDLSEAHDLSTTMPDQTQKLHTLMTNFLDDVHAETRETQR